MNQPSRSELGNQVSTMPRPLMTMRGWILVAGLAVLLISLSPRTSALHVICTTMVWAVLILVIRFLGMVRFFELGLESNGTRMLWGKLVAYRLSWALGSEKIILIEQESGRELPMYLSVFRSDHFREAVGDKANLKDLAKVGIP